VCARSATRTEGGFYSWAGREGSLSKAADLIRPRFTQEILVPGDYIRIHIRRRRSNEMGSAISFLESQVADRVDRKAVEIERGCEQVRIISARPSTSRERTAYEEE